MVCGYGSVILVYVLLHRPWMYVHADYIMLYMYIRLA